MKLSHIALCGPVNLPDLRTFVDMGEQLPNGYLFPFTGELALAYKKTGLKVTVVTLSTEVSETKMWKGDGITIVVVPKRKRPRDLGLTFYNREVARMVLVLKSQKPDVIHAFWNYEYAHAALKSGLPYFVTSEDAPWVIFKQFKDAFRFLRFCHALWVFPKIRFNVAISPYLIRANRLFTWPKKVELIPNAVSADWNNKTSQNRANNGSPKVYIVGTWDVRKNVKVGIHAFHLLRERVTDATLHLIGTNSGPSGMAHKWCKENGLDEGVNFLGAQSSGDIRKLFEENFAILLHPSLEESFGMTLIEAMACGVPVVGGYNSGAVPWVLGNGTGGLLCDVQDPRSIGQALQSIITSPELYNQLGQSGSKIVNERFRLSEISLKYKQYASMVYNSWRGSDIF